MRLVLVALERASKSVRLLSDATFSDRSSALAELERVVSEQNEEGIEHFVVDLESATPVLLLSKPSTAKASAQPEAPEMGLPPEAPVTVASAEPEIPVEPEPELVAEASAERPVAQAGPAITPASDEELAASLMAAASALDSPEVEVEPLVVEPLESVSDYILPVEAEAEAEPSAQEDEALEELLTTFEETGAVPSPPEVEAAPAEEAVPAPVPAATGKPAAVPAADVVEEPIQWPWDKRAEESSSGDAAVPAASLAAQTSADSGSAGEKGYEPGALDMQKYTCADCVYLNTCPNRDQKAPFECGSFQWRSD